MTAFVVDGDNHRIRKIDLATQVVTTLAGSGSWSYADGLGANASFNYPASTAASHAFCSLARAI